MAKPKRYDRKKLLIDPHFQLRFLGYSISTALLVTVVFFTANRIFFWMFAQKGRDLGLPQDHIFFRFIEQQRWTMDVISVVTAFVVSALLVAYGLYFSNRIAGPIHHLKHFLRQRLEGDKTGALQFRKNDFFPELPNLIEQVLDKDVIEKTNNSRAS